MNPSMPLRSSHALRGRAEPALAALRAALLDDALAASTRDALDRTRDTLEALCKDATSLHDRHQALFDAIPDPITLLDEQGRLLDLNRAALQAYGWSRDEVIGQPVDVLSPDLAREHKGPAWDAIERGESYVIDTINVHADGTRRPVEVHAAGFEHDGVRYIVTVTRDLTGRRNAELRYRELMETIDKGVIVRDADGRMVYANAAAMRMFDLDANRPLDGALGHDRWLVIDENGRELAQDEMPAVRARSGVVVSSTVLGFYQREQRRLIWVSVTAVPQFVTGTDHVEQVLTLFTDVTELKRDSSLFDRAQSLAHIGGWEWEPGHDRLYLTDEAQRILGHTPAPRTMDQLLARLRDGDRRRLRIALDVALAEGRHIELEIGCFRDDGRSVWMRFIGEVDANKPLQARLSGTLQDITERRQQEETRAVQARNDTLTHVLNRDAALFELQARLEDPTQAALAVLYIDLDRFKLVNDVLGHAAGDRLLGSAARRIQRAVGSEGLIARFGGDEFLVICTTGDDPERPVRLAKAVLDVFGDSFRMEGEEFSITASIGIAEAPADGTVAQALIQNADVAMYDSKRRARNAWQRFTPELAEQQQARLQLENQLRRAIENHEFRLLYQPQVDLATGVLVGVEALIRWRNQELGEIRPDLFIGHAEMTGDIVGIGTWALREACRQMRHWRNAGVAVPRVAVNVSYRQFVGEGLVRNVRALLNEFGLDGASLELEVTERVLIEDVPETLRAFAELRDMGIALSIDDFGEGYSALNYLRRLPIHGLKLSQLFVRGVPDNQSDVAVCQAVAGIAKGLGLSTVAEGVESERQRVFLRDIGIDVGQGYLYAPALSADEIESRYGQVVETR
ncbi:MAG: diguanylate cyclase/phosphodiesterase (GGDEF & EAL domains) with PAS/PAC sensor(s) [uncultured Lysobacter sp.]|uniref:Diguanylate cyclase/phosphodiesterase (GGDEF & EAL domains) with PAS/PAC sensor(S) n=1 Tax=uncultured Lysobacter sp. TaxID=271060 RepID=A0A6J4KH14_9GAMM|nr:MAG: diguanylate cyclase/phosphodiesterase (GGDEF & EAL domains) with PAS/PAC sensor(s) [uncultured Lysobacter sp.]